MCIALWGIPIPALTNRPVSIATTHATLLAKCKNDWEHCSFPSFDFRSDAMLKEISGDAQKLKKTPDHTISLLPRPWPRQCVLSHSYYSPISGSVCYRASPISDWHCFHVGIGAMTHLVRQTLPALMKYKSVIEFLISPSITSRTFKCHGNTSTFTRLDVSQSDYDWTNSFHSSFLIPHAS